jgi:hypothetical protein
MLSPIRLSPFLLAYGLSASTASFLAPAIQQHHVLKEGESARTTSKTGFYKEENEQTYSLEYGNPDHNKKGRALTPGEKKEMHYLHTIKLGSDKRADEKPRVLEGSKKPKKDKK